MSDDEWELAARKEAAAVMVPGAIHVRWPLTEIGSWAHADATVEEVTHRGDFWEYAELSRTELLTLMAGGLDPEHALAAVITPEGDIALADGCHRYSVARDLGHDFPPVRLDEWDDWFGTPDDIAPERPDTNR